MNSAKTNPEPIHPGEHLADIMEELGISQYRLAKCIGVPPIRVHAIIKRHRPITADTALCIGRALGTRPDYWLNLQHMYDLDVVRSKRGGRCVRQRLISLASESGTIPV